mgnify:CR=1 FL=1
MEYSEGNYLLDMVIQYGEANLGNSSIIDYAYESIWEVSFPTKVSQADTYSG